MTVRKPRTKPAHRRGFTLVEMLTVIVIIGILAALTIGGSMAVRNRVRISIVTADIKQLEMALQNYKSEVGELPPDFSFCGRGDAIGDAARGRVMRHLRKRFPRYRPADFAGFLADASTFLAEPGVLTVGTGNNQLNPSTALTFWLGGDLDADGKPRGFHENPSNPFQVGEPRTTPYYDFDSERLDGFRLLQPGIRPESTYVYFRPITNNETGELEYGVPNRADPAAPDPADPFLPYSFQLAPGNVCVPYIEAAHVRDDPTTPADANLAIANATGRLPIPTRSLPPASMESFPSVALPATSASLQPALISPTAISTTLPTSPTANSKTNSDHIRPLLPKGG